MCETSGTTPDQASPPSELLFAARADLGERFVARVRGVKPLFVCVIASTDTALIPGISAAGASLAAIPYTPAADAEALEYGAARCLPGVPSNPLGPPGPALLTRAALTLAGIPHLVLDAGCHVAPDAPTKRVGTAPGATIVDGKAVPAARALFDAGFAWGQDLAAEYPFLVIGESVPGGTTTALALLLALRYQAEGRVSSSMAANAHALKHEVVERALRHWLGGDPLAAVATLGDPMQPTVTGLVVGATAAGVPVLLAGGTQMVAVAALLTRLGQLPTSPLLAIGTTRWVVDDPTSDIIGLLADVAPVPLLATPLSFATARRAELRAYEDFLVKEGVGAGGAILAASLSAGIPLATLQSEVERLFESLPGAS